MNLERNVLNRDESHTWSKKEEVTQIVKIMTRYTLLSIVSSIGTLLFILSLSVYSFVELFGEVATSREVANFLNTLDMLIDLVVMTLMFPFADKYYWILCKCADKRLSACCIKMTREKMAQHAVDDKEMVHSHNDTELTVQSQTANDHSLQTETVQSQSGVTELTTPSV